MTLIPGRIGRAGSWMQRYQQTHFSPANIDCAVGKLAGPRLEYGSSQARAGEIHSSRLTGIHLPTHSDAKTGHTPCISPKLSRVSWATTGGIVQAFAMTTTPLNAQLSGPVSSTVLTWTQWDTPQEPRESPSLGRGHPSLLQAAPRILGDKPLPPCAPVSLPLFKARSGFVSVKYL